MSKFKVWKCKLVIPENTKLPMGFDWIPRHAAVEAVENRGIKVISCFSGWGGKLDKSKQEIAEEDFRRIKEDEK